MRVTVIGDRFIWSSFFKEALEKYLSPIVGKLTYATKDENWPDVPLVSDDEIGEFVGDPSEIAELSKGSDVIVTHLAPISRAVLEASENLQIIGCCRGGPVNINVAAANQRKIAVINAPGRNSQTVVEFTLGLILTECRGISRAHCALADGVWRGDLYRYDRAGRELNGQTIGLIGFGIIARMLVPYLRSFQMRVLVYDPYVAPEQIAAFGVDHSDLDTLLKSSDIISMHARATPETRGMIGVKEFRRMKPGAYFINTARGSLVDESALYAALKEGRLAGAALDTFSTEPPPEDWPLLKLDNVTLTPHIAGSSREAARRGVESVVRDIAGFFIGKPLEHCVNPVVLNENLCRKTPLIE